METFGQKILPIIFQLERFVDKTTFNSHSLNKVIDFVTAQCSVQYFCPFLI